MKKRSLLIGLIIAFTRFLACRKGDTTNANAEQFNCNIDGKFWSYKQCSFCSSDALTAGLELIDFNQFTIVAGSSNYPQTEFRFVLDSNEMAQHDTIELASLNKSYAAVYRPYVNDTTHIPEYRTVNGHEGRLIFTRRTSTLIEGTFEMEAANSQNKIAHFTEGKFLIHL